MSRVKETGGAVAEMVDGKYVVVGKIYVDLDTHEAFIIYNENKH